jgi:hypothetical protein
MTDVTGSRYIDVYARAYLFNPSKRHMRHESGWRSHEDECDVRRPSTPRETGAKRYSFSARPVAADWMLHRRLVAAALADGRLTVAVLREGFPATRALVGRGEALDSRA